MQMKPKASSLNVSYQEVSAGILFCRERERDKRGKCGAAQVNQLNCVFGSMATSLTSRGQALHR